MERTNTYITFDEYISIQTKTPNSHEALVTEMGNSGNSRDNVKMANGIKFTLSPKLETYINTPVLPQFGAVQQKPGTRAKNA